MNFTSYIARRFLFSRKSHSIVNLIAVVSFVAITIPTAAMILVLSLHNGIYDHLRTLYSKFDSPLRVTAITGQFFEIDSSQMVDLRSIGAVSATLQCNALIEYTSRQTAGIICGVDSAYTSVSAINTTVERGEWRTKLGDLPRAVVGSGLSYNLGLSLGMGEPIYVYAILPSIPIFRLLELPMLNQGQLEAAGVFALEAQTDGTYLFTDIDFVRQLTGQQNEVSSLQITPSVGIDKAKERIFEILGDQVIVEDSFAQRSTVYSVVESEKWMVYLILTLVALIASMSLIGCTLMMMSEKHEAVATLRAIGMRGRTIRSVFIRLSMIIVAIGVTCGVIIGVGLSLIQLYLEPLKMVGETLLHNSYMVAIYPSDILITILCVLVIGFIITALTVRSQREFSKH